MAWSSVAATAYESSAFTSPPMRTDAAVVTEIAAVTTTAQLSGAHRASLFVRSGYSALSILVYERTCLSITCFSLCIFHRIRQKKMKNSSHQFYIMFSKKLPHWRYLMSSPRRLLSRSCYTHLSLVWCVSIASVPSNNCIHCTTAKHMMALSRASPCAKQVVFFSV